MLTRRTPASGPSLAELLDDHALRAWGLARRIVADDGLAEDVVQEAVIAYWRDPAAFDGTRGSFASWFLGLVHHKAVDVVRREAAHRRRADAAADRADLVARDVAETVVDVLADGQVRSALASLSHVQREALVLAYWGGYTQRQIAEHTGAPLGTVKTRMFAGMRCLQGLLDPVTAAPGRAPLAAAG